MRKEAGKRITNGYFFKYYVGICEEPAPTRILSHIGASYNHNGPSIVYVIR